MTEPVGEGSPSTDRPFASMIAYVTHCASGGRGLDASARGQWQSKLGFVMATAGAAVGLGNIWRFPILVAENGGGAFVAIYLILVAAVGIPAMMAEVALGRRCQRNCIGAFRLLTPGSRWPLVGGLGVATSFIILSYYSVIAGWTLGYIGLAATGRLLGLDGEGLARVHAALTADPAAALGWHLVFMALTVAVVALGVSAGLERWSRLLMPCLLVLLILLLVRVWTLPGAMAGIAWFLRPDWSEVGPGTVLKALGQLFFSLSLGMGALVTYGSYLRRGTDIPGTTGWVAGADTTVSLLAGLTVIPALFAFGLPVKGGPALTFVTFPAVFNALPAGSLFGVAFFAMLAIAALTSSISMLEVVVAAWIEERGGIRRTAAVLAGAAAFLLGVPAALSQGAWDGARMGGVPFLGAVDSLASNLLLPLGGLLTAVYIGWVWGGHCAVEEIREGACRFPLGRFWPAAIRFVVPAAIAGVLLTGLLPLRG